MQQIIESYKKGNSISVLAKMFHHRATTISKILHDNNVTLNYGKIIIPKEIKQEVCDKYESNKYTKVMLMKEYGISDYILNRILKEHNISTHKNIHVKDMNVNDSYFHVIDTEDKAYFLGFIFADGNISGNQLAIEIHVKDKEILEKFKECIHTANDITERKRESTHVCTLRICSPILAEDLKQYGVIPNKTKNTHHLPINLIPQPLLSHFLRGLVDGDGWVSKSSHYYHIGFCSHYAQICQEFQDAVDSLTGVKNSTIITTKGTDGCHMSQYQSQQIVKQVATVLYTNCEFYLTRKYKVAQELLHDDDIV